jgi:hypothetical protein
MIQNRKLLLHKAEIHKLLGKTQQKGLTLVPLRIYFQARIREGRAQARQGKLYDRRETIKPAKPAEKSSGPSKKENKARGVLSPDGPRTVLAPPPGVGTTLRASIKCHPV